MEVSFLNSAPWVDHEKFCASTVVFRAALKKAVPAIYSDTSEVNPNGIQKMCKCPTRKQDKRNRGIRNR